METNQREWRSHPISAVWGPLHPSLRPRLLQKRASASGTARPHSHGLRPTLSLRRSLPVLPFQSFEASPSLKKFIAEEPPYNIHCSFELFTIFLLAKYCLAR